MPPQPDDRAEPETEDDDARNDEPEESISESFEEASSQVKDIFLDALSRTAQRTQQVAAMVSAWSMATKAKRKAERRRQSDRDGGEGPEGEPRERRRRSSTADQVETRVTNNLKKTLQDYLDENEVDNAGTDGKSVRIDNQFVKEHGARLLPGLLNGLMGEFLSDGPPRQAEAPSMGDDEPPSGDDAASERDDDLDVSFDVDLPTLLREMLGRPPSDG